MAGTMIYDSSGISGTQIQIPAGKLGTFVYYYWRIKAALSSNSSSEWSAIWRFNIILNAPNCSYSCFSANGATTSPSLQHCSGI